MESLKTRLENIKTLTEFNNLIDNEVRTGHSFMGERIVQVGNSKDSLPLMSLWNKYTALTEKNSEPLSLNDRIIGLEVANKLRIIESQKSSIESPKGLFGMIYKIGVYLRQFIIPDENRYDSFYRPSINDKLLGFTYDEYVNILGNAPYTLEFHSELEQRSKFKIKQTTFLINEKTLRNLATNQ